MNAAMKVRFCSVKCVVEISLDLSNYSFNNIPQMCVHFSAMCIQFSFFADVSEDSLAYILPKYKSVFRGTTRRIIPNCFGT